MTLLSAVSRQMHQETALMPFQSNRWLFATQLVMYNYLYHLKHLSRSQMSAIKQLVVLSERLDPNLLDLLKGLKGLRVVHFETLDNTFSLIRTSYTVERDGEEVALVREPLHLLKRY
ncbi:hypothetical protein BU24DRAFT_417669 [Aaosphaeria arxii CBS 175.79]|uniref:Uncharacterized protein n=1 Tax=Aaosphaeria arxii CBS 175.79 TaxID=1450172 RepID=A0A6A5Y9K5_9PLEO|nr:uncharacterized protein BU24DRAFT_417669 [Aaosphaeria arxii CBS 175.79]KAF2022019.1 hypothetical protein BU24DRAFT_417669 [Aaosphaeria arxii CBS 175.79]